MKTILINAVLLLLLVPEITAQKKDSQLPGKNGIYAELYVLRHDFSDGFVSINYERIIGKKQRTHLRVGLYPDFNSSISFPLTISWITGPARIHHFECGVGAVIRVEHYVNPDDPAQVKTWFYDMPALMVPLMYRYQKSSGLFFRGGLNVFLSWPVLPSPSLSIGYRF